MKTILALTGVIIGVLFAAWDTIINNADSAPPDCGLSISIFYQPFFISKVFAYLLIGAVGRVNWFVDRKGWKENQKIGMSARHPEVCDHTGECRCIIFRLFLLMAGYRYH